MQKAECIKKHKRMKIISVFNIIFPYNILKYFLKQIVQNQVIQQWWCYTQAVYRITYLNYFLLLSLILNWHLAAVGKMSMVFSLLGKSLRDNEEIFKIYLEFETQNSELFIDLYKQATENCQQSYVKWKSKHATAN